MEAVTILRNDVNNHRLLQIDLDELEANDEALEDLLDIITVEMRKNVESISWEEAKDKLQFKSE